MAKVEFQDIPVFFHILYTSHTWKKSAQTDAVRPDFIYLHGSFPLLIVFFLHVSFALLKNKDRFISALMINMSNSVTAE